MGEPEKQSARGIRPETLLGSVMVLLLVNVFQRGIGFGRGVLFCRWMDPHELGHWDMAYGFLLLAAPVAVLGLPGSFGRYLEKYRQQGQLRVFLTRAVVWTFSLAAVAVGAIALLRHQFAYLVFGDSTASKLMLVVAIVLACVILHHFLEAVFAGLRLFRVVSAMQFAQSMLFASISLSLLTFWRSDAWSVVAGYGSACAISATAVLLWSRRLATGPQLEVLPVAHREFWPPLLRFAIWVWVSNLLCNLFAVIDRYMIVHYSQLDAEAALSLVGHYHTSMLVPLLLVSVANLLVGAMTPHLSHDWESGRRSEVGDRLRLVFKLATLGMFAAGVGVLAITPTLFHAVFEGKYDEGLSVLPWALASCVWFSLLLVTQTYVWCAEKTRHACVPLAIGLAANVLLNLLLLPILGLQGAVMATALATFTSLLVQLYVNHLLGMRLSIGMLLCSLMPFGMAFGITTAAPTAVVLGVAAALTPWIFNPNERTTIGRGALEQLQRFVPTLGRRATPRG